jgi:hypothetical protein
MTDDGPDADEGVLYLLARQTLGPMSLPIVGRGGLLRPEGGVLHLCYV